MRRPGSRKLHVQSSPSISNFLLLNEQTALLSCMDSTLRLVALDAEANAPDEPLLTYRGHRGETSSALGLAVGPNSRHALTCCENGGVIVYDFVTGSKVQTLREDGRLMCSLKDGVVVGGQTGARVYATSS